jgi:hypothetical protein
VDGRSPLYVTSDSRDATNRPPVGFPGIVVYGGSSDAVMTAYRTPSTSDVRIGPIHSRLAMLNFDKRLFRIESVVPV